MKKHIEVVAGVIVKDGKIFCAKRGNQGELAKKWEFPGGKVEQGETLQQSLYRELKEELRIEVEVKDFILTVNHEYETFKLTLHGFYCDIIKGEIALTEHLDSKWLNKDELESLDWAAADIPFLKILQES